MDVKPPFSGTVREYSTENFICDENGQEVLDSKIISIYDRNHKISEVHRYDANNELSEIISYTYDNRQNLLEITVKTADENIKQSSVYEYKDDKLYQITDTAVDFRTVTRFDDHGNPVEKQNLDETDSPFSTSKYINLYDENGRLVEKHTVFPLGEADWVDRYRYNAKGLLIEEQRLRHQINSLIRHRYNAKGDLTFSEYNPGESNHETLRRKIFYDGNNDILEIKEYRKGWCYQDRDEFVLNNITRFSYVR